jgi:hypothetical protein
VFGEGNFLNAKVFASEIQILCFVNTTRKNLVVSVATFIFVGLI